MLTYETENYNIDIIPASVTAVSSDALTLNLPVTKNDIVYATNIVTFIF
jgi:hypothetical protein